MEAASLKAAWAAAKAATAGAKPAVVPVAAANLAPVRESVAQLVTAGPVVRTAIPGSAR